MSGGGARGFVALMSAIIIASILLLVAVTGGLTGIFARGDALDLELKARSVATADACADQALLALANDSSYTATPNPVYTLNSLDECRVGKITTIGAGIAAHYEFKIQATSSKAAVTNLLIDASTTNLSIISWQEIAQF